MQENNQGDTMSKDDVTVPNNTETTISPEVTPTTSETTEANVAVFNTTLPEATVVAPAKASGNKKVYLWSALAILVMVTGLLFVLEKEGRVSTGLFASILNREDNSPIAIVNDVEIVRKDYDSSLSQLVQMAASQGVDTTDPALMEQYETQALDTLVNGELLRQSAVEAGMEASSEAIETRFNEIRDGIGGQELLDQKMDEFGITEDTLRRDIENEILIQGLFDKVIGTEAVTATDEEVKTYYDGLGGKEAGLPPLDEVKVQVAEQVKLDKQQKLITAYIEEIRKTASIEILI